MIHRVQISKEFLVALCVEGARMTWPGMDGEYAVCSRGFSAKAQVREIIVGSDAITVFVDDPETTDLGDTSQPLWRRVREEPPANA